MYEMKYIAHSRMSTLVVAGSADRRAVICHAGGFYSINE
jgi:hypothetical protein